MTSMGFARLLREVVDAMTSLGIPYMVVGSFAGMAHGLSRTTLDLDVVIDPTADQLEQLLERFADDRYYVDTDVARDARRRRTMFNVIDQHSGWKLDLIIRKARRFSVDELARRVDTTIHGVVVATATAEDTIVAKLEWSKAGASERQLEDVAAIVRARGKALDLDYIERWVDELELREQWGRARKL
ncbi:MAG TPA: hypothetical protein VIV11_14865 [Kofleriaceae bacterium]